MPFEPKTKVDFDTAVQRAARRRATDEPHVKFTGPQIDQRTQVVLNSGDQTLDLPFSGGQVLASGPMREFLKDTKFFIGAMSEQVITLGDEIDRAAVSAFAMLDDVRKQVAEVQSSLSEHQLKAFGGYSQVHVNAWTRSRDRGLDWDNELWLEDFCSGLTFLANEVVYGDIDSGLTLPLQEVREVPIRDVRIAAEATDFGSTGQPLFSTSPRNLLLDQKTFRWVVTKTQFTTNGQEFTVDKASCTLVIELAGLQTLNTLVLQPLAHIQVTPSSLVYLDENGVERNISYEILGPRSQYVFHFAPVRTRTLILSLTQTGAVTSGAFSVVNDFKQEANNLLEGAGFTQKLTVSSEAVAGKVYDFSLETLSAGLRVYGRRGLFRGQPMAVKNPLGIALDINTVHTTAAEAKFAFNDDRSVTPITWVERYAGVELKGTEGDSALMALLPLPDTYPRQTEALPMIGNKTRLKLFPDLLTGLTKIEVDTAVWNGTAWDVTTVAAHGLTAGITDLVMMGPRGTGFTGTVTTVAVPTTTSLTLTPTTAASFHAAVTADDSLPSYVFRTSLQTALVEVYQDQTLLTLGTDYEISVDGGSTYYSYIPAELTYPLSPAQIAGKCWLRFSARSAGVRYSAAYTVAGHQKLEASGQAGLRNGKLVFGESARASSGKVWPVIVLRGAAQSPYVTPLIESYSLKIREL
jgi:hypothetical protein